MTGLKYFEKPCPYCGEIIAIQIDISAGSQMYYEDCQVCCRPIFIDLKVLQEDRILVNFQTDSA